MQIINLYLKNRRVSKHVQRVCLEVSIYIRGFSSFQLDFYVIPKELGLDSVHWT